MGGTRRRRSSEDLNVDSIRFQGAQAKPRGRKSPCYSVIMTSTHELKSLSDDELLRRLAELVQRSRRVEAVLVAHIAEVDERRLYIREAPSMFAYCTQVLHLSEHEAYARITVARASRRHQVLLAMLSDGRLHLSGIGKLVPHLRRTPRICLHGRRTGPRAKSRS